MKHNNNSYEIKDTKEKIKENILFQLVTFNPESAGPCRGWCVAAPRVASVVRRAVTLAVRSQECSEAVGEANNETSL